MSQKKNFERVKFVIQLIDPMKEVVADRGGGWGSMLHGLSRCCGDRSERWATKLLVGKIRSVVERQIASVCSSTPFFTHKNLTLNLSRIIHTSHRFVKSSTFKILLKCLW